MNSITTFDSTREALLDTLRSIGEGKTQLPDFQRGWVWDDEHIRSLLASISLSYPIGAVMMLEAGGDARFKPRLVEGVQVATLPVPERLILDGQQRLTSLLQALYGHRAVDTHDTRGNPIRRWYYLNIAKALDPNVDREDAIVGLPDDRVLRNFRREILADYSTTEKECAGELLPLPLVFDVPRLTQWQMQYLQAQPSEMPARLTRWNLLMQEVIQRFQQYQVPLIVLRKETPKDAVCQVFEKVNTGGVALTVFELLTATFAVNDFNLRDDWTARAKRLRKYSILTGVENTDFLQAVTLLATRARRREALKSGTPNENAPAISAKRRDVLRLSLSDYRAWADMVTEGFELAARFLHEQNIYAARDLPYRTQLVPLAAVMASLGSGTSNFGVRQKLTRWYWCGVFGELYGGAIETRFARDLPEVLEWAESDGDEPSTVAEANFVPARLGTLRTRNSAAYKGLYALLMRDGAQDFASGGRIDVRRYFDDAIDIHHIFPWDWCSKNGVDLRLADSVVNKTPIAARTNRVIGGNAPSNYLPRLQQTNGIGGSQMDGILHTHLIDPRFLRADRFDDLFKAREEALLTRIEQAMGKPILRGVDAFTMAAIDQGSVMTT